MTGVNHGCVGPASLPVHAPAVRPGRTTERSAVTPRLRSSTALLLLALHAAGCSFGMRAAPDRVENPSQPVDCNSSTTAPVVDAICASIFLSTTINLASTETCESNPFVADCMTRKDRDGLMMASGGLAALCAVGAVVGFKKQGTCERVKATNTLCIKGDEAACLKLNSAWQPPMRLPAAPEAAPAGVAPAAPAGCTKDVDCKGDRVCEQGTCVPPRVKEAP